MTDYTEDEGLMCPKCGAPEHRIKIIGVDFCVNHYQCGDCDCKFAVYEDNESEDDKNVEYDYITDAHGRIIGRQRKISL